MMRNEQMRTSVVFACLLLGPVVASAADYPIQPVPFTAVHVQSEFWSPRLETNRQTTVWMARTPDKAAPIPRVTIASESKVTASHIWQADHLDALHDQLQPGWSGGILEWRVE